MLDFLQSQLLFYSSLVVVLFLPGYFLLLAVYGGKKIFSSLEELIFSIAGSIIAVDFLMLALNRFHILITRASLWISILVFCAICYAISKIFKRKSDFSAEEETAHLFNFSKKQTLAIIGIILLTVFVKVTYLSENILPQATDLGHHMYWAKEIATTGTIPNYTQRDVEQIGSVYQIGISHPISDFVIGEHLIFSAVSILSGLNVASSFPIIMLWAINLASVMAIFLLALRFFKNHSQAKNIAILALLFIGPLFAISPPEAKYVAGGVIGNILGDFFLPVAFYFFGRALFENNKTHAAMAAFIIMGLFYTHHLTGFILLLILLASVVILLVINLKNTGQMVRQWLKLVFSKPIIYFLIFAAVFVLIIYTPSYLSNTAIKTVVGGPSKIDHTGMAFSQFKFIVGEPRAVLGLIGGCLALFWLFKKRDKGFGYAEVFLIGWIVVILLISLYPAVIKIDLPSTRAVNYSSFPFSIFAAFALMEIIVLARRNKNANESDKRLFFNPKMFLVAMILLFSFAVAQGFYDNKVSQKSSADPQKTVQTFAAAEYLAGAASAEDQILHDHVFVTADAWIKLFFMRDYDFPFYRANFDRYSNGIDRKEQCTLWMISTPQSEDGQKCYEDLGMDFVLVNKTDAPQFQKGQDFWKVYNNGEINIFYRPKNN